MNRVMLLTMTTLFFIQCKSEKVRLGKELLPLEQTKSAEVIDEYIQDIEYIKPDMNYFLYSGKMLLCKNGDFISRSRNGDFIAMDSVGKFKRIIARYGKGHREYISSVDFTLSKNEDYLMILDVIKIKVYGIKDSTYYNEIKLSTVIAADAIAPSSDNNIFLYAAFSSDTNNADKYLVSKINENGDILKQFMKRDDHTFSIDNITQSWGNEYYLRPQNAHHIFYKFDDVPIPAYQINLGNKNIPYQYNYRSKDSDIGVFMTSPYYKLPIYLYETKNALYFSAAGPNDANKCNYLYFKNKTNGINWNESKDEPLVPLISSDENYFYFMYNGINSGYYNKDNPTANSPLFRYISNQFINKWNLSVDDDVIVKVKFKEKL